MKWLQQPESQAAQHDEVIEALFGGDVDAAVEALRAHFETSRRFLNERAQSDV
jgi:DNA-binding GntR family transcriptional regulator